MAMKLVDAEQLEADLTSVADKIRAKTGGEEKLAFPSGFESALDTIESADSALAEVEYNMSDGYTNYNAYCASRYFTELPYSILRYTRTGTNFTSFCSGCSKLQKVLSFDVSSGIQFSSMFYNCYKLTSVAPLNTENGVGFSFMFADCPNLITIGGINLSNATSASNVFRGGKSLENITFNGVIKITGLDLSPCTKLTHDSLMSAINALYDYASEGTTGTFKLILGSTNLAKLTDAEKAIATQKGWTLA